MLPATMCPSKQEGEKCLGRLRFLLLQGQFSLEGATRLCCPVKPQAGQMPAQEAALPLVLHCMSYHGKAKWEFRQACITISCNPQMLDGEEACVCVGLRQGLQVSTDGHRPIPAEMVPFSPPETALPVLGSCLQTGGSE